MPFTRLIHEQVVADCHAAALIEDAVRDGLADPDALTPPPQGLRPIDYLPKAGDK
jgi:hypothetical protein